VIRTGINKTSNPILTACRDNISHHTSVTRCSNDEDGRKFVTQCDTPVPFTASTRILSRSAA
jgi:hypothetical protein